MRKLTSESRSRLTVLDYSEFIYDRAGHAYMEEEYQSSTTDPKRPELFFTERGSCPFCRTHTSIVYERRLTEGDTDMSFGQHEHTRVWSCKECGWWEIEAKSGWHSDISGGSERTALYHGSLQSFAADDVAAPVSALRRYVARRPEVLNTVHPRKLEELVRSVFRDFFQCEVHYVGGPRDGGVDLIVVQRDQPFVVQVKRRSHFGAAEAVSTVRQFLGAMLLKGQSSGTIVTTAHSFSEAARSSATQAVTMIGIGGQ